MAKNIENKECKWTEHCIVYQSTGNCVTQPPFLKPSILPDTPIDKRLARLYAASLIPQGIGASGFQSQISREDKKLTPPHTHSTDKLTLP